MIDLRPTSLAGRVVDRVARLRCPARRDRLLHRRPPGCGEWPGE